MKPKGTFKCLSCNEIHSADARNRGRQHHCGKPGCRKASKAASQRRWLAKPGNRDYFRGPDNVERVRAWRAAHPGYWRRGNAAVQDPLQEPSVGHEAGPEPVAAGDRPGALQDICAPQPALLVGLISVLTGSPLQEDIAASARSFLSRGRDILGRMAGCPPETKSDDERKTSSLPRAAAARAAPV